MGHQFNDQSEQQLNEGKQYGANTTATPALDQPPEPPPAEQDDKTQAPGRPNPEYAERNALPGNDE